MKTTVTVYHHKDGYKYDVFSESETKRGVRGGIEPLEIATRVTQILAQCQHTGAVVVAPDEVMALIPEHLRDFEPLNSKPKPYDELNGIMHTLGRLARVVYGIDLPINLLSTITVYPLRGIAMMSRDMRAHPNQKLIGELMDKIDVQMLDCFSGQAIPSSHQGGFLIGYYQQTC